MKFHIISKSFFLITILVFSISACSSSKITLNSLSIEYTNVEIINHEEISVVLDTEETKELCITIMDVQFSKNEKYAEQFDVFYRMKFLSDGEEVTEILILSQNSIVYDEYIYKCSETMLYLDGFELYFS